MRDVGLIEVSCLLTTRSLPEPCISPLERLRRLQTSITLRHYFIEVNPRIQVEHTVTEQVRGFVSQQHGCRVAVLSRTGANMGVVSLSEWYNTGTGWHFSSILVGRS